MKKLICVLLFVLVSVDVHAAVTIYPNDPNIQYTGRIDFSNPLSPLLSWSGSSVIANFQGTSLQVTLNDQGGTSSINYFYSIIDNGRPTLLTCTTGQQTYTIATGLSDTTHKIELYKRTEGSDGLVTFLGFILDDGKALTTPPARPIRKIEYYGDSITAGLALESTADVQTNNYTNNYLAYGSITARNLHAEHHTIAISGIGLYKNYGGDTTKTMANYYYSKLTYTNTTAWDFTKWTPDLIVINLGGNDYSMSVTQTQFVPAYVSFVNTLRTKYNDTTAKKIPIILALGDMKATQSGSLWPGYIQLAIDSLQSTYSDYNVYKVIFPYNNLNTHPHALQHAIMAQQLTAFIISTIPGFSLYLGDLNNDGYVNNLDFALLSNHWLEMGCVLVQAQTSQVTTMLR